MCLSKEEATDLKTIYQAPTVEMAVNNLDAFAAKWDARHLTIAMSWQSKLGLVTNAGLEIATIAMFGASVLLFYGLASAGRLIIGQACYNS